MCWEERIEPPSSAKYERGGVELGGKLKCGLDRSAEGKVYGGRETHLPTPTLPPSPPFLPFSLRERLLPLEDFHSAALTLCRVSNLEGFSNQDHSGLAVFRLQWSSRQAQWLPTPRSPGCHSCGQVEGEQGC